MLSIKGIASRGDTLAYYANLSEAEGIEYWSEDGKRAGVWWGKASNSLGLEGEVTADAFKNLLEGCDGAGRRDLVKKRKNFTRRRGFDLTFSVPKSFSVLYSLSAEEQRQGLKNVAEKALYAILNEVQELCGVSRRGYNGRTVEEANLVAAVFSHETSRNVEGSPPDCNLHWHAVFPNLSERTTDGTFGAIDARALFQPAMKLALGGMFRAELTKLLLQEKGIRTFRPMKEGKSERVSWFELEGVPPELLAAMSKRRREIERYLKKHGLSGAKAAEKAALKTRRKKELFSRVQLDEAWEQIGKEHGVSRENMETLFGQNIESADAREQAHKASARAVKNLLTHNARFTRNELLEATAVESQGTGAGISEIKQAVAIMLEQQNNFVRLQDKRGVPSYTTKEMLSMERAVVRKASRLALRSDHPVSLEASARVLRDYPTMRAEQREALRSIAYRGDAVSVTGVAGAGKSYVLNAANKVAALSGYTTLGTALSASTARDLGRDTGITSIHIHKLLKQIEKGEVSLDQKTWLFIEEAGQVGTRHAHALIKLVEQSGAKLVMVGDPAQLSPVEAGAPYQKVASAIGTTMLEESVRQEEEWARDAALSIRHGQAEVGLAEMAKRGRLVIEDDRDLAINRFVSDWCKLAFAEGGSVRDTLAIAGQNVDVRELNEHLQAEMKARGQLGDYSVEVGGYQVHLGDFVMVTKNYPLLNLQNGTRGEVTGVRDSTVWLRTEDGFQVEIETEDFSHLSLDYANTVYKSQGKTVENALLLCDGVMTDREQSYVGATRARKKTIIYTSREAVGDLPELAKMMNKSRQNEMAMDYLLELG